MSSIHIATAQEAEKGEADVLWLPLCFIQATGLGMVPPMLRASLSLCISQETPSQAYKR